MLPTTQRTTRKTPTHPPYAKKIKQARKRGKKKVRLNLFNSKIQFLPGYQGDLDQHWWLLDSYRSPHRMNSCATCWIQLEAVLPSLPTMRIGSGTVAESLEVVFLIPFETIKPPWPKLTAPTWGLEVEFFFFWGQVLCRNLLGSVNV